MFSFRKKLKLNRLLLITSLLFICFIFGGLYQNFTLQAQERDIKEIGILMGSDLRIEKIEGLIEGLEKYGYEENKNIEFTIISSGDNISTLPQLALELAEQNPDVLVATGEKEVCALQQATKESQIPIVFIGVGLAQELGFVESYSRPGGNITGVDNYYLKLSGKRLEYFQRLIPDIKNIAVIYDKTVTPAPYTLNFLDQVASQLNINLLTIGIENEAEALQYLQNINAEEVDGVILLCSLLMESITDSIIIPIQQKGIPALGVSENQTKKGFLASYGMSYRDQGIQASRIVAKVLQGQDPALIPIEAPAKVDFIINTEVAEQFQDKIDPAGFACATKFIR